MGCLASKEGGTANKTSSPQQNTPSANTNGAAAVPAG